MKIFYSITVITLLLWSCESPDKKSTEKTQNDKVATEELDTNIPKNQKLTKEQQIASAILAAPSEAKEGAKVYGYDEEGNFIIFNTPL
ncbi:MAG: hypothetical protein L3J34_03115 [Flavobacteriaceae bacterium]|nr:hypothetical protein [Flavobacteriaceae bacterium]